MIITDDQTSLSAWLCSRIGYTPTEHLMCIGNVLNHKLKGVVGYDMYNGASIMMHSAGEGNWLTREFLRVCFHYPFVVCRVNMVIGLVPSANHQAIRFNHHIGFKTVVTLDGAHPDGALVMMTMSREECRFLEHRSKHGQEKQAAATA